MPLPPPSTALFSVLFSSVLFCFKPCKSHERAKRLEKVDLFSLKQQKSLVFHTLLVVVVIAFEI